MLSVFFIFKASWFWKYEESNVLSISDVESDLRRSLEAQGGAKRGLASRSDNQACGQGQGRARRRLARGARRLPCSAGKLSGGSGHNPLMKRVNPTRFCYIKRKRRKNQHASLLS